MDNVLIIVSDFSNNGSAGTGAYARQIEHLIIMVYDHWGHFRRRNPHKAFLGLTAEINGRVQIVHSYVDPVQPDFRSVTGCFRQLDAGTGHTAGP